MTNLPVTTSPSAADVITTDDADWLDHLTENITAIIVEAGFITRQTKIRMYWLMGQEIVAEEARQLAAYEADQSLPPDEQICDLPASRAYIVRHVGDRIAKYEGFIGTGRTALYDAANFAELCPTAVDLEETLQRLEAGKNANWRYVCRQLLPGHENDPAPSQSVIYYSGVGTLSYLYGPRGQAWTVELPPDTKLEAEAGDTIHIIIREDS